MQTLQQALEASLEDHSISRSERKELNPLLALTQGDRATQAKVRQFAFGLACKRIEETGEPAALEWLEGVIKLLYSSEMKVKASAYFSPGEDCLHRIRRLIGEARRTLDICVFTITDNRIVEKLEEALARGTVLRVISDDTKSEDLGSDLDHLERIGIECRFDRTSAHMHHKFAIADTDLLLTGSYNWTRSASSENNENIIVSNNTKLVHSFQHEFDRMWRDLS
ncbi:MAG: phospholipase D-like domain-containing protein [Roseibacillus sp.]|jgi:phosphatidylserine/phosphatidylglycerophosphate/cardiolipin synthase-like enzyme